MLQTYHFTSIENYIPFHSIKFYAQRLDENWFQLQLSTAPLLDCFRSTTQLFTAACRRLQAKAKAPKPILVVA